MSSPFMPSGERHEYVLDYVPTGADIAATRSVSQPWGSCLPAVE